MSCIKRFFITNTQSRWISRFELISESETEASSDRTQRSGARAPDSKAPPAPGLEFPLEESYKVGYCRCGIGDGLRELLLVL